MAKYVWNKVTGCRVPLCPRLDVDGNPDLEWRDEEEPVEVVPFDEDDAAKSEPAAGETKPGDDPVARARAITDAMYALDPEDEAHFTKSGKPDAKVLSEKCGFMVSASERDELWEGIKPPEE